MKEVRIYCGACDPPRSLGLYHYSGPDVELVAKRVPRRVAFARLFARNQAGDRGRWQDAMGERVADEDIAYRYYWKCSRGHEPIRMAHRLATEIREQGSRVYLT